MGREDEAFLFVGTYASEAAAQEDYEGIKELHAAGVIGGYDAAVIRKDENGKVHLNKDETSTRKGAWGGAVVGAVVGVLFPPSLIASAAVGALAGGLGGHILGGMSRKDVKELGDFLEEGDAALLVVGDWQLEEAVDKAFARAERHMEREIKGIEREAIETEYSKMMSGKSE